MRTMTIDGEEWRFKVGESFVNFRAPSNKGTSVHIAPVLGMNMSAFERDRRKRTLSVTPLQLRVFIEANREDLMKGKVPERMR